jgi:hypothetical protein
MIHLTDRYDRRDEHVNASSRKSVRNRSGMDSVGPILIETDFMCRYSCWGNMPTVL